MIFSLLPGAELGSHSKVKLPLGKVIKVNNKVLDLTRPHVMAILNVTPDSFSDGGKFTDVDVAAAKVLSMVQEGATIIDIGAESTRPGAAFVSAQEELNRICPVLEKINELKSSSSPYHKQMQEVLISIDTSKPEVMQEVLSKYKVDIINDVRALRERNNHRDSLDIVAAANVPVILMHMQGKPRSMQREPRYEHVVKDIYSFFEHRIEVCLKHGIKQSNILLDPGFGFGKTWFDNASLLKYMTKFQALNCPLVVGLSRKSMITRNDRIKIPVQKRLPGSLALACMAVERGASIIRCHDVAATKQAIDLVFDVLEDGNCVDE